VDLEGFREAEKVEELPMSNFIQSKIQRAKKFKKRSPDEIPVKSSSETSKPFKVRKNFADIRFERAEWKPVEVQNRENREASIRQKSAQTYKVGRYITPARFPDMRAFTPWLTSEISNMHDRRQR